jgi:hypothetical protein
MPIDPISTGLMIGGKVLDFFQQAGAAENARRAQAYQREDLARAMYDATGRRGEAMRMAGGLQQDRFGNATYYDPVQRRWITYYTPRQQRLIEQGQERQERANIRGAQASKDYDLLRGEYLYRRPKSEAESYAEIVNLLNQATGTGERALNTLMNRFNIRTAGNIPQLVQADTGPSPGQQLAETMLKARQAALEEYGTREKLHQTRYLPAMKQFEETANYMAPLDPTGSEIQSMTQKGLENMLKYGSEYDKLIASLAGRGVGGGGGGGAASRGGGLGSLLGDIGKMFAPEKEKASTGTLGGTRGARASSTGSGGGISDFDNRFNYYMGPSERGSGGEAAPFGRPTSSFGGGKVYGAGSGYGGGAGSVTEIDWGDMYVPDYGDVSRNFYGATPYGNVGANAPFEFSPWIF